MAITRHVLPKMYSAQSTALHNDVPAGCIEARQCRVTVRNTASLCRVSGSQMSTSLTCVTVRGDKVAPPGWVAGDGPRPSEGVLGTKNTHETDEQTTLTGTTNA